MPFTGIDLFSGAGGLSLAALNVGVEIRAAVENDHHACETYRRNIIRKADHAIELFCADITNVCWKEVLVGAAVATGECDILLGGPPCQGFSTHRIKDAGVGDPRNELLFHYFGGLKAIRPKVFLIENVTGILWPRHENYLRRFLSGCRSAGYVVFDPMMLNARDFGVPQNRRRVFILGVRDDLDIEIVWPPASTHFDPRSIAVKKQGLPSWRTATDVFRDPVSPEDPNAVHMRHTEELQAVFKNTPKSGGSRAQSGRVLPCHKKHDGHKDVYGRIDLKKPGPTMTTGCVNPSKGRFVHPTANHAISARHAARFQAFPEDFVFVGGLMAAGRQIGNAVPVTMGEALIDPIVRGLARLDKQQRLLLGSGYGA